MDETTNTTEETAVTESVEEATPTEVAPEETAVETTPAVEETTPEAPAEGVAEIA